MNRRQGGEDETHYVHFSHYVHFRKLAFFFTALEILSSVEIKRSFSPRKSIYELDTFAERIPLQVIHDRGRWETGLDAAFDEIPFEVARRSGWLQTKMNTPMPLVPPASCAHARW